MKGTECSELGTGAGMLGVWRMQIGKLLLDVGSAVQLCKHYMSVMATACIVRQLEKLKIKSCLRSSNPITAAIVSADQKQSLFRRSVRLINERALKS